MSEQTQVNMSEISVTTGAAQTLFGTIVSCLDHEKGQDYVTQRLGPYASTLVFLQQQAMHTLKEPNFEPTPENVATYFDYTSAVGWMFAIMPVMPEAYLRSAIEVADVAPWFYEAVREPAVAGQPLWPTVQTQMMMHMEQAIYLAKALIEEITLRIPEILEA